jgi:Ca2+-binding RTX toxin-like protein
VVGTFSTTDVDDLSHTYTILPGGTGNGLFTIVGNEIRVAATLELSPEVNTVYTLDIQTDDGHGGLHNEVFNITITNDLSDDVVIATLPATFTGTGDPNDNDAAGSGVSTSAGAGAGGTVSDETGASTLAGSDFGETFNAGNGDDTVYGRGGNDTINGQGASDTSLFGQAGDDLINGGAGADEIYGGSGNDTIYGMQNPETSSPSDAGDTIFGGSGSDAIYGQAGDDIIVGGYGADNLSGGGGADTFRYLSLLDTGDTIIDFSTVQGDKIDLFAIDANTTQANDQAFSWGGHQTGQNVQAHSVTWFQSGSNVVVLADTDGNLTTAEFSMTLTGISSLNQNDFLL